MKIFVTVGTQLPFDRLIEFIDNWCVGKDVEVFGQIGEASYLPNNFAYQKQLGEEEFNVHFSQSDLIISHAGMGTIIRACVERKGILTLPRLKKFGEHRNDHQIATTKGLVSSGYLYPIYNLNDFSDYLEGYREIQNLKVMGEDAEPKLIKCLKDVASR